MKAFAKLVAILLCASFPAHAQFTCVPNTESTPNGPGSHLVTNDLLPSKAIGDWRYVWCPAGGYYADGKPKGWNFEPHAVLAKYRGATPSIAGAMWAAYKASDVLAAINAVTTAATIIPTDPQELYGWRNLRYAACLDASTKPYIVDILDLPAGWCGAAPVPPGPPVVVWRTPRAGSSFTLYTWGAAGLTGIIAGRTAPPNALCDSSVSVPRGTSTYMPLAGAPQAEVTLCQKQ